MAKEKGIKRANSKGITLVALVVTIIVLLILAGITINQLISDDGIINHAIQIKAKQHVTDIKEVIGLKILDAELANDLDEDKLSFYEIKDMVYANLDTLNLIYDTQVIENMIIVNKKYPIFLTNTEEPTELDKNLYEYQINQDSTAKITKYKGDEEKVVIPQYIIENGKAYIITTIGDQCFANNPAIAEVVIPDNIVEIGSWAFERSANIKKITMSDSVKKLNYYGCFGNLEKLEEITLSENITVLPHSTFSNDINLKKIHIPNSVTEIGETAFANCSALKKFNFPTSLKNIGNNAFLNCFILEELIMPASLESIGNSAFENVGFGGYGDGLKRIVLNEGLKTIGERAFQNCHSVKEDLILPSTITNIGDSAFESFGNASGKKVYYSDGTEYKM